MDFTGMTHDQILDYIGDGLGPLSRQIRYDEVQRWRRDQERRLRTDLLAAEQARTGIFPGVTVRRTTGKPATGEVVRMGVRDQQRERGGGWKRCDPYVEVEVHWSNAVRWLGGKTDWRSTVRLSRLVRVEGAR
jgi:hypothetical protein